MSPAEDTAREIRPSLRIMIRLHKREQLLVIGRGEDNRRAGVGDFAQEDMDIEFGGDVDAAGGFVEQENARSPRPPRART